MYARAVILPDIYGVLTFRRDPGAGHIRCLADFEQRQTIAGFQVSPLAVESSAKLNKRLLIFVQRIADQSDLQGVRVGFRWARRSLAQIFAP